MDSNPEVDIFDTLDFVLYIGNKKKKMHVCQLFYQQNEQIILGVFTDVTVCTGVSVCWFSYGKIWGRTAPILQGYCSKITKNNTAVHVYFNRMWIIH